MKIRKVGLSILGHELYVKDGADAKAVQQRILKMSKQEKKKKPKNAFADIFKDL